MADSGVDTSNESSDNPVFPRVLLEFGSSSNPRVSLEFEPTAIPLPPVPGVSLAPVHLEPPGEVHEYVGKIKNARTRQGYRTSARISAACTTHNTCRRREVYGDLSRERRLRLAASTNNTELVEQLLDDGANPDVSDAQLRSPLHLAACRGFVEVVRTLLRHGADPNIRDSLGNTPLHLAACTSHLAVVTALLKGGADSSSNDAHGRTPLDLARSKLRLIRQRLTSSHPAETRQLAEDARAVVDMTVQYLRLRSLPAADARLDLESVCARLERVSTREQMHTEVQCLLDSLDSLKLR